jgi:hypothetical protein
MKFVFQSKDSLLEKVEILTNPDLLSLQVLLLLSGKNVFLKNDGKEDFLPLQGSLSREDSQGRLGRESSDG